MCGRYSLIADIGALQERFDCDGSELTHAPRCNIAPTQMALTVTNGDGRRASHMRRGLIPSWAKGASVGSRMINAFIKLSSVCRRHPRADTNFSHSNTNPTEPGLPPSIDESLVAKALAMRQDGHSVLEIAAEIGLGSREVQNYLSPTWLAARGLGHLIDEVSAGDLAEGWPPKPDPKAVYRLKDTLREVCFRTQAVSPIARGGRLIKDFGPLEAGKSRKGVASEFLGLGKNQLAVLRMGVYAEDIHVALTSGQRESDCTSLMERDVLDIHTPGYDPTRAMSEFWLWGEDQDVRIEVLNPTEYDTPMSRVEFMGWVISAPQTRCRDHGVVTINLGWGGDA